jgi:uncharacterized protein YndB with AHSA1/START domain
MVQWMGDEATLDPRPGGVFRVSFLGAIAVLGEFVEVVPPSRVVFTWGWEQGLWDVPPATTIVEVALEPDGDGTRVRVTHRDIPAAAVPPHAIGWQHYFDRLALAAAGDDAGPDTWPDSEGRMLNPFGGTWSAG